MLRIHDKNVKGILKGVESGCSVHSICVSYNFKGRGTFMGESWNLWSSRAWHSLEPSSHCLMNNKSKTERRINAFSWIFNASHAQVAIRHTDRAHRELPCSFVFVDGCSSTTSQSTPSKREKHNLYSLKERTADICGAETHMESSRVVNSSYILATDGKARNSLSPSVCFPLQPISIILYFCLLLLICKSAFPPFRISFALSSRTNVRVKALM